MLKGFTILIDGSLLSETLRGNSYRVLPLASWLPIGWLWLARVEELSVRSAPLSTQVAPTHSLSSLLGFTPGPEWDVEDSITLRFAWTHLQNRFEPVEDMSGKPAFKISTLNVTPFTLLLVCIRLKCASGK